MARFPYVTREQLPESESTLFDELVPENFETSVTGDVGLAWGTYIEQWQDKGQPPEQARVRFSKVLTKGMQGCQVIQYHCDIQSFTDEGRYTKALTVVSPDN